MQFGSDNQTGASPQVLEMLVQANDGFTHGYGDDQWCGRATSELEKFFGCALEVFFVATGTAANSLALSCLMEPWETVLCHHQAHIVQDESTAPEFFSGGGRIIPISRRAGKLQVHHLQRYFKTQGDEPPHTVRTAALSLTQTSEAGLVYTPEELFMLCTSAHEHGLHVHMDGARFASALASLGCTPADITWKAGVDVLSLGATKCGALAAEAVVFFSPDLATSFIHRRKRSGHLVSKGRLFGAQFVAWLKDEHWLELARHANAQAQKLLERLSRFSAVSLQWPCDANEIFVTMPVGLSAFLHDSGAEFYEWPHHGLPAGVSLSDDEVFVRLVTSFVTSDEQIEQFCELIAEFFLNQE